jgi:hypothetical protein
MDTIGTYLPDIAPSVDPEDEANLADRLIRAFLIPALSATDWREKWKSVNRAAGVIAGWSIAAGDVEEAEGLVVVVEQRFESGDPARVQITDGLRKRVAEILVLMA